jgi:adenylate kinase
MQFRQWRRNSFAECGDPLMRLILIGPPGSGKGTQATLLSKRLSLAHISTGVMFREAMRLGTPPGIKASPFVASGRLVPDELVNDIIAEYFGLPDRPSSFIIDGYPRTLPQAKSFDTLLKKLHLALNAAIYLKVDDAEVIHRLAGRGREDDMMATVRKRLEVFHSTYGGLLEYYRDLGLLRQIAGEGDVESIYTAILKALGGA